MKKYKQINNFMVALIHKKMYYKSKNLLTYGLLNSLSGVFKLDDTEKLSVILFVAKSINSKNINDFFIDFDKKT